MKIGIDIGGSHIEMALINNNFEILESMSINKNFKGNIKELELVIDKFIDDNIDKNIDLIGFSLPGIVKDNILMSAVNLNIHDWKFLKELEEKYRINIISRNDAVNSLWAELKCGSLREKDKVIYLCLGTGVGSAIFKNDSIENMELGHMEFVKDGINCNCGKNGCFERYASMKCFKESIRKKLNINSEIDGANLLNLVKNSDYLNDVIEEYLNQLSRGIKMISEKYNINAVCLGGSFVYYEEILYKKLEEKLPKIDIILAKLKNDSGVIGSVIQ